MNKRVPILVFTLATVATFLVPPTAATAQSDPSPRPVPHASAPTPADATASELTPSRPQHTAAQAAMNAAAARKAAAARPNRGMGRTAPIHGRIGRYQDSNVAAVWHGASHAERSFWKCVRSHESVSYTGENPVSTASGAGQWLRGTWAGLIVWVKIDGKYVDRHHTKYPEAKDSPAYVQDAAFRHVWRHGGVSMWRGVHCGYGT